MGSIVTASGGVVFFDDSTGVVVREILQGPRGVDGVDGRARELGYASTQVPFSTTAAYDVNAGLIPGLSVTVIGEGQPVEIEGFFAGVYSASLANRGVIPFIVSGETPLAASTFRSPVTTDGPAATLTVRMVLVEGQSYTFKAGIFGADAGTSNVFSGSVNTSYISVMAR